MLSTTSVCIISIVLLGAEAGFDGESEGGKGNKYWLDGVNCEGNEDYLFACRHKGLGIEYKDCSGAAVRVKCRA